MDFCKKAKVKTVAEYEERLQKDMHSIRDRDSSEDINSRAIPDSE
jgi:hypothetical protein